MYFSRISINKRALVLICKIQLFRSGNICPWNDVPILDMSTVVHLTFFFIIIYVIDMNTWPNLCCSYWFTESLFVVRNRILTNCFFLEVHVKFVFTWILHSWNLQQIKKICFSWFYLIWKVRSNLTYFIFKFNIDCTWKIKKNNVIIRSNACEFQMRLTWNSHKLFHTSFTYKLFWCIITWILLKIHMTLN